MKKRILIISIVCALLSLTGCLNLGGPARPDSATFYLLASRSVSPTKSFLSGHSVYIRAATLPGYLDSGKIAVRDGYKINYSIEDQWSEPLQQSVTRCIGDAIQSSVSPSAMSVWPEPMSRDLEYYLQVNFTRFNAIEGGEIEVEGSWQIINAKDHSLMKAGTFKDYSGTYSRLTKDSLVKGLSNALGRVCDQIVQDIGE